ncbi:hypothetical protein [Anoxybacillus sp. MB8]|uniref:hypothetical protein n=1 Tax=Anoxybacillus sp. MB8 TaxID=2496850 RepID=UPI0013D0A94A|nr:hypothetical protein [Anoxybacillus sp. MB8]
MGKSCRNGGGCRRYRNRQTVDERRAIRGGMNDESVTVFVFVRTIVQCMCGENDH